MQRGPRKRKLRTPPSSTSVLKSAEVRPNNVADAITNNHEPYPTHPRPTAVECRAIRDDLLALHGFPQEFAKYRRRRQINGVLCDVKSKPLDDDNDSDGDGDESVLDGLVKTVLSQNTTDVNSQRAFASLKSTFPTWEKVSALSFSFDLFYSLSLLVLSSLGHVLLIVKILFVDSISCSFYIMISSSVVSSKV